MNQSAILSPVYVAKMIQCIVYCMVNTSWQVRDQNQCYYLERLYV